MIDEISFEIISVSLQNCSSYSTERIQLEHSTPLEPQLDHIPILFCHGLGSNRTVWRRVAEFLSSKGNATAFYDMSGHGESFHTTLCAESTTTVIPSYNIDRNVNEMHKVLTFLGEQDGILGDVWKKPSIIVGHSYGANIILEYAIQYSDQVLGIICIDGGFIDLQKVYPEFSLCMRSLSPPPFHGMTLDDLEKLIRNEWCNHWPELGIQSMLKNFRVLPNGFVSPILSSVIHAQLLRNLWEHHPSLRYPELNRPAAFLVAGNGEKSAISANKRADMDEVEELVRRVRVDWFPDSGKRRDSLVFLQL